MFRIRPLLLLLAACLLLQLPNVVQVFYPEPSFESWRDLSVAFLILTLPVLAGLRMRFWFRCCSVLLVLVPLVTIYYCSSQTMPAVWTLLALYETDLSELARFGVPMIVVVTTTPLLLWFYWSWLTPRMTQELGRAERLILAVLLIAPVPITMLKGDSFANASLGAVVRQANGYPANVWLAFTRARMVQSCFLERHLVNADVEAKAPPVPAGGREIHVLVIGESARFKSFQINGAQTETTPRLAARKDVVSFQEAVAPACMTGLAVPALITPATAKNIGEAASMPSVSAVFRKAGYSTWWLSSQRKHGIVDTRCSMFSEDSEHTRFVSGKLTAQFRDFRSSHDGDLLPHLEEALASDDQRIFIVLHTMGSHCLYMDRYPKEFEKYPVDSSKCVTTMMKGLIPMPLMIIETAEARQQLTNAYHNTIHYTDWLLAEIIQRLEGQKGALATLTYVSDHGENDANAQVMPFCHGVIAPDTLRVPMFVWASSDYRQQRPEKMAALSQHVRTPFCSDTAFHTVIDLAGVESSLLDRTQSAASGSFAPLPRLLVDLDGATLIDFDKQVLPIEQGRKGWRRLTASLPQE